MGFLKQMKDMKNVLHEARATVIGAGQPPPSEEPTASAVGPLPPRKSR